MRVYGTAEVCPAKLFFCSMSDVRWLIVGYRPGGVRYRKLLPWQRRRLQAVYVDLTLSIDGRAINGIAKLYRDYQRLIMQQLLVDAVGACPELINRDQFYGLLKRYGLASERTHAAMVSKVARARTKYNISASELRPGDKGDTSLPVWEHALASLSMAAGMQLDADMSLKQYQAYYDAIRRRAEELKAHKDGR